MNKLSTDVIVRVAREFRAAQATRQNGNEGKARVLARRAAGWAIGDYRRRQGEIIQGISAFSHIDWATGDPATDETLQTAADNLTERIDYNHQLRSGADALAAARLLIQHYLPAALV